MSKRERSKRILASLRKGMLSDPNGLNLWRPRQQRIPDKRKQESRNACRGNQNND